MNTISLSSRNDRQSTLSNVLHAIRMFRASIFMFLPFFLGAAISNAIGQEADYSGMTSSPLDPVSIVAPKLSAKQAIFVEYRGTAGYYSLNYERNVSSNFSVRVGGSVVPALNYSVVNEQMPEFRSVLNQEGKKTYVGLATVSYVQRLGFLDAEVGVGGVAASTGSIFPTSTIGLRFKPFNERLLLRTGYVFSLPTGASGVTGAFAVGAGIRF